MATVLQHPTLDDVAVEVPDKDVKEWLEQGWRPVDAPEPGKDEEPVKLPKPGPRKP